MTDIIDFNNCIENDQDYGGNAGRKLGIIYNDQNWILKFPNSTAGFRNVKISYTTAPLSEYIGSHVYELLGIPVHETLLGIKDEKVVVACRDFLKKTDRFKDFKAIKNRYNKELQTLLDSETSGSGDGTRLDIVLAVIDSNKELNEIPSVRERFWDMFVVDAVINNNDRNNGNWGIIIHDDNTKELAPVYDNGNSFSNKADIEKIARILSNETNLINASYISVASVYEDRDGKKINPNTFILNAQNEDCNRAVQRIQKKLDLEKINEMIDSIPETYKGISIIDDTYKKFIKETIRIRKEQVIDKAVSIIHAKNLRNQGIAETKKNAVERFSNREKESRVKTHDRER